jgi:carboxymethylenebutenolidase
MATSPEGALLAEPTRVPAPEGGWASGYLARPTWRGTAPAVVVLHHLALAPNLHFREERHASRQQAAEELSEAGGLADDQFLADFDRAVDVVRNLPTATGKVGLLGFCSGGRQAYLAACTFPVDAVVACYAGRTVARPDQLTPRRPVAPVERTATLSAPLLWLSGREDKNPSPDDAATVEAALTAHGKEHEVHVYDDTGHAFFAVDRPSYRPVAATDGWNRIISWFGRHLT